MSSIAISGDTSGTVTIAAPAIAGTNTMTLVAGSGSLAPKVMSTAVSPTSGSAVDFTNIPSWVTRIAVAINGVSINNNLQIQLGTGAGPTFTTSGYTSVSGFVANGSSTQNAASFSGGFSFANLNLSNLTGLMTITNITGNTWVYSAVSSTSSNVAFGGGSIALGAVLTAIRVTSTAGTPAFTAGTINIMYE